MEKYISKSALVAEIKRIKREECPIDTYEGRCKLFWFEQFLSFLNTLEGKEVDLEKEIEDFKEKIIKSSKVYRAYREECGIKDPILLDEVEEAYYAAYEQCYKDSVKSHRECYQKLDCGKWYTKTK